MIQSTEQEIRTLRSIFWSGRDPEGRVFVPLADAYRRAGDFRQAVELLTEGLERHPDFTSGHLVAAQLYHEAGLAEEAELAFRRVLDIDDENVLALELLAESLDAQGEAEEAEVLRERHQALTGAAPAQAGVAEAEPVMELAELAPEPEAEPVMELAELAPEPGAEPVMELAELAPDAEAEPVMELAELAPDVEAEPVMELAELAPDVEAEPELEAEPVMELAELAPEPEAEAEPVMELAELAPDVEAEPELEAEPVMELAELAPEPAETGSADQEIVGEIDDLPMVTRTMAELFASQGLVDRALDVLRQLLEATPGDPGIRQRIAELSANLDEPEPLDVVEMDDAPADSPGDVTQSADEGLQDDDDLSGHPWDADAQADHHDVDTPFAWTSQEADEVSSTAPPVADYFATMLGWEPGTRAAPPEPSDAPEGRQGADDLTDWLNREDS